VRHRIGHELAGDHSRGRIERQDATHEIFRDQRLEPALEPGGTAALRDPPDAEGELSDQAR
jgi:hypothetical protein